MRLGVTYDFRNPPHAGRSFVQLYHETLNHIVAAEDMGFDTVWLTEHHFTDDGYLPSLLPMAAAIAQRTKKVRIGTNVILLPLHHPLRVAEDGAVVDILSNGRFALGAAVGYRPMEFEMLGVSVHERGGRIREQLEIIAQAWTQGSVSYRGRYYSYDSLPVSPRPVQQPRPPIYLGGTSRAAIRRAASQGDGFLVPGLGSREEYDAYMAEVEACGKDPSAASYLATNIPMYVSRDHNKAWDDVKHHILYQENVYAQWYMDAGYPDLVGRRLASNADALNREAYLVGSPAYVLERIARHQETVPFTHIGFWAILPGQDPAAALRSLEIFAAEVLPHLK